METLFIGQNLIKIDSVDSTNNFIAKLNNRTKLPEGSAILAQNQNSGKGQRGNSWVSEPKKNLLTSVLLRPLFLLGRHQFYLSKITGLAALETIRRFTGEEVKIKWPNDIYINEKKVAGILIENNIVGNSITSAIIGLGLNVNQTNFAKLPMATSLKAHSKTDKLIDEIAEAFYSLLEKWYLILKQNKLKEISSNYHQNLYRVEEWANYEISSKKIKAKILRVDEEGLLHLLDDTNKEINCDIKEVVYL